MLLGKGQLWEGSRPSTGCSGHIVPAPMLTHPDLGLLGVGAGPGPPGNAL